MEGAAREDPKQRRRVEVYQEENFEGADLTRTVHIGWGVTLGAAMIFLCFGMSAITQNRSWNVSFKWLQRRVGAQFGTMTYLITSNVLYYHDGDRWVTRDVAKIVDSLRNRSFSQHSAAKPALDVDAISSSHRGDGISRGFAADAAAQQ
uniref:Uncharacterized protein n=1 Tax=Dunaliella tertiolecta TaxID=3047 RepID=A0A7S3VHU9_DUNTE|mmetsp:Transcript_1918/g.4863  ORF Transcript_1918/g.4863 Transcript_1918/m.4863 type:complete len:149 (-) Transcript_1918:682-1128(-)|eukprot:CAMPEP_0202353350 /NCGR_PEP_ID=MMETSP1126-20121109/9152_1 /ASSEMBLY_ACC=CAM_ASM_000457 /TAXON_ID=3047 /ORGANISM="Dunaliella tertiolecta, Strain CCMP1320" /LENGTH=148 /DNA_ID=CAMNT_0048945693 /DNA_START=26 /DNA_END=472 /DNA_ORIENTATION=-